MTDLLRSIDDFFFDSFPGFQKIQDWTQLHLGVNCFKLAYFATAVWLIFNLAISFAEKYPMAYLFFILIIATKMAMDIFAAERSLKLGFRNYLYESDRGVRIFCLSVAVVFICQVPETAVYIIASSAYMCFLYFLACTPLPPSDSTIKKWWNSLGRGKLQHA